MIYMIIIAVLILGYAIMTKRELSKKTIEFEQSVVEIVKLREYAVNCNGELADLRRQVLTIGLKYEDLKKVADDLKTNAEELADRKFETWKQKETEAIRDKAVKNVRSILHGKTAEHFVPQMLKDYDSRDCRWIGDPIDYLVCAGANLVRDGVTDEISEVLFVDAKTGNAGLNKVQRRIRDAVIAGRVGFATFNPDTGDMRKWTMKAKQE